MLKGFAKLKGAEYVPTPNFRLLDAKREGFGPTSRLLAGMKSSFTKDDIGKIFYTDPKNENGTIVSREEFQLMNPDLVGGWIDIGELDVEPLLLIKRGKRGYLSLITW